MKFKYLIYISTIDQHNIGHGPPRMGLGGAAESKPIFGFSADMYGDNGLFKSNLAERVFPSAVDFINIICELFISYNI